MARLWGKRALTHSWYNVSWYNSSGELGHTKKLHMGFSFDWAISLLDVYPNDTPPTLWKYICTTLFITSLLIKANYGKEPINPYIREWLNYDKSTQWRSIQVLKKIVIKHKLYKLKWSDFQDTKWKQQNIREYLK